jgi:tripartite-type tricarboxylate transporter receptor subunit TctC
MPQSHHPSAQRRRALGAIASLSGAALAPWPMRVFAQAGGNARIIVGFAAGGGADLTARVLAEKMREAMPGMQITVENRTGAAGKIAVDALRGAPADGRTLLLAPLVTPVLSQLTFANPGYDPGKDLAPVGMVGHFQFCIAVGAAHPAKTMGEFIAWLKANPAKANFGSPSPGSLPHFFGVMLGRSIGVDVVHVPYKGGAPMLTDLMGGQIASGIDTVGEMVELNRSGKIRILASFAPKRFSQLPDVPTMTELGFADAVGSGWYSLWAKAGTPAAEVSAWNKALNAALANAEVKEKFNTWGTEAAPGTPEELEKTRLADIARWRPVVAASGFKAD